MQGREKCLTILTAPDASLMCMKKGGFRFARQQQGVANGSGEPGSEDYFSDLQSDVQVLVGEA
jgi:hypothetical protein